MIFIRQQIEQIRSGGMPVLRQQVRAFPRWFLWQFATRKYSSGVAYYLSRIAVFLFPNWAGAHVVLAGALISLGRFDEAFAAWQQALLFEPDWQNDYGRIMYAFHSRGQLETARSIMQRYLDTQNNFAREHQLDKLGIRFLCNEFTTHVGHIALLDYYVKMGILGRRSTARPIPLISPGLSNPCYLDYWRRHLPDMITDPVALELLGPLAKYLEDYLYAVMDASGKQICELYIAPAAIQSQWESEDRGPLLTLSDADQERGWQCLRSFGVPAGAWFVGLHIRDAGDGSGRNSDIDTYRLSMESIVAHGGWVIRMGDPAMKPLSLIPHVIDYVHSAVRSDWMDVFLWASCRFFIGTDSGPIIIPPTFGVPCVVTNFATLGIQPWFNKDLCIFKLYWSEREACYLNFEEVLSLTFAGSKGTGCPAFQGIEFVDNTPQEINDVVIEMLDRLEGKLQYSNKDEELQERFARLYSSHSRKANARIGRDFLRKWEHLL
jgi:putative glycosyltransferase (TIGR04372 family)